MKIKLIVSVLAITAFAAAAAAQWPDRGNINTWAFSTVSNAAGVGTDDRGPFLKAVRVSRNKGFDRLVFEFTYGIPRYQVKYVKASDLIGTDEKVTKVGGRAFMDVDLQGLPYPDDPKAVDATIPKGNQHLTVFNEIKEIEWFEGVRDFAVGVNARKAFRVQELEKPYRLVIDFKQ